MGAAPGGALRLRGRRALLHRLGQGVRPGRSLPLPAPGHALRRRDRRLGRRHAARHLGPPRAGDHPRGGRDGDQRLVAPLRRRHRRLRGVRFPGARSRTDPRPGARLPVRALSLRVLPERRPRLAGLPLRAPHRPPCGQDGRGSTREAVEGSPGRGASRLRRPGVELHLLQLLLLRPAGRRGPARLAADPTPGHAQASRGGSRAPRARHGRGPRAQPALLARARQEPGPAVQARPRGRPLRPEDPTPPHADPGPSLRPLPGARRRRRRRGLPGRQRERHGAARNRGQPRFPGLARVHGRGRRRPRPWRAREARRGRRAHPAGAAPGPGRRVRVALQPARLPGHSGLQPHRRVHRVLQPPRGGARPRAPAGGDDRPGPGPTRARPRRGPHPPPPRRLRPGQHNWPAARPRRERTPVRRGSRVRDQARVPRAEGGHGLPAPAHRSARRARPSRAC